MIPGFRKIKPAYIVIHWSNNPDKSAPFGTHASCVPEDFCLLEERGQVWIDPHNVATYPFPPRGCWDYMEYLHWWRDHLMGKP